VATFWFSRIELECDWLRWSLDIGEEPFTHLNRVREVVIADVWHFRRGIWPEFCSPTGNGHTDGTGLPVTWSETENVAWKTAIPGRRWSSPVISHEQIWLASFRKLSATAQARMTL